MTTIFTLSLASVCLMRAMSHGMKHFETGSFINLSSTGMSSVMGKPHREAINYVNTL